MPLKLKGELKAGLLGLSICIYILKQNKRKRKSKKKMGKLSKKVDTTQLTKDLYLSAQLNEVDELKLSDKLQRVEDFNFVKNELLILKYWRQIKAFETSLEQSKDRKKYTFYDGPPFATGLPHYGHILAGTIKDVVTRYAHQTGHHVERRFGWDCHGLPIEYEIEKKYDISGTAAVLKMGITKYNELCRGIVMKYSNEWKDYVERMGRWIDFENNYKTMNVDYMESVWWVFEQMWKKGLVFQDFKVMPYSNGCRTPLSNFETGPDCYKIVDDPEIYVTFPIVDDKDNASLVAWTTTPWTLPSNVALCVNPGMTYVKVLDIKANKYLVVAECLLYKLFPSAPKPVVDDGKNNKKAKKSKKKKKKNKKKGQQKKEEEKPVKEQVKKEDDKKEEVEYRIVATYTGKELEGTKYVPLFDYFVDKMEKAFFVVSDMYVTDSSGTGIVHQAPAFGEDDMRVCRANGIYENGKFLPCPLTDDGHFTDEVKEWAGQYIKDADKSIAKHLKDKGRCLKSGTIKHSYPHCWRSDVPLIYRAVPSWFIDVPSLKEKLIANNKKTKWVPEFVQTKRFHNWLSECRDWAVSRNRYWGTPIPIWMSEDGTEKECIGSIADLKKWAKIDDDIKDIHRDKVDDITFVKNGKVLKRIPEVFDCWFESGSMPYAQQHYPFENKEKFEEGFPADFIGEGIDQTRGWFYTLMVISTAIFDDPPFKNLIANGMVLAEDGKKMSKRLKNYPNPMWITKEFGADALRTYLIASPVVRAETLKFSEKGVRAVVSDVFIPWTNVYKLFVLTTRKYEEETGKEFSPDLDIHKSTTNPLDLWILSALNSLIGFVHQEMKSYHLDTVTPRLIGFIRTLSKWYVRLNKNDRLKGKSGAVESARVLSTLFVVLYKLSILMAPFTPFLVEGIYLNLRCLLPKEQRADSIHFLMLPERDEGAINEAAEKGAEGLQKVIDLGRQIREKISLSFKYQVQEVEVVSSVASSLEHLKVVESYIKSSVGTKKVTFSSNNPDVKLSVKPEFSRLGKRLGKDMRKVLGGLKKLTHEETVKFQNENEIEIGGHKLVGDDVVFCLEWKGDEKEYAAASEGTLALIIKKTLTQELKEEGTIRSVVSGIQNLRKLAKLNMEDRIAIYYDGDEELLKLVAKYKDMLDARLGKKVTFDHVAKIDKTKKTIAEQQDGKVSSVLGEFNFKLTIQKQD